MYKKIIILYGILFLALRIPAYYFYDYPVWNADGLSYLLHTINGWYFFDQRLPVYSLFIESIAHLTHKLECIPIAQTVISLLVSVSYLLTASKLYRKHFFFHLLFVLLCYCNPVTIFFELSILSESLYFNLLFLFFHSLRLSFAEGSKKYWLFTGLLLLLLLLTKQAALFILPVPGLAAGYLLFKRRYSEARLLTLPAFLGVLIFAFYNLFSLGKFAYSPFGGFNLLGTTILYMDTSSGYPKNANDCIMQVKQKIPSNDFQVIHKSRNLPELQQVFSRHYNDCWALNFCLQKSENAPVTQTPLVKYETLFYDISIKAIKENPVLYFKFFTCMVWNYFATATKDFDFRNTVKKSSEEKYNLYENIAPYCNENNSSTFYLLRDDAFRSQPDNLKTSWLFDVYQFTIHLLDKLALSVFWMITQLAMLVLLFRKLLREKSMKTGVAIFILAVLANLCNAIGTSLVEETFLRYSYPFLFSYYYVCIVIPFLFDDSKEIN